ncbi:uncharacterized protein Z519_08060 [Cladophialophora bantiana CBS 173.52]|uniref:Uncharacterized protein n=1 Tax=Cladophialophora bantiana (strain ATCC 10958 / CBS 173.52 / CDC B-1940 / NIH 8579) TaxID=1442370 RepID=A0A0D2HK82_CLAB1|nr:uncharacterized protein Z519_08060 [Cladophialophora bantiana CBS 173.52]KIW91165.1 hypothetical protein Z519_08060 [Cladophialophora bantiana CBS 173.52]
MTSTTQSWAAATQSWASWLLDSYASSVSPMASDTSFRHHEESNSISEYPSHEDGESSVSSISMSSAYGPYVKTGRGGAGNFNWHTEVQLAPRSTSPVDLEANRPPHSSLSERRKAAARLESINTQDPRPLRQNSAQYLSAGRGGAGNYVLNDMKPLQRSPSLPASFTSSMPGKPPSPKSQNPYPVGNAGRGGAGNYAAAVEAKGRVESEKEQEERLAAEQRRDQIVEEVDGLLQPPPGAWLGGGRRKSRAVYEDV